jgi:glycogen(starch) synthase
MVALEAAAAGAPIAVAATGGLAEIVEPGVTGMTFPTQNPEALADSVANLLGDDEAARHMARRARAMVRTRYDWPSIAARTVETYRATLTDRPGARIRTTAHHRPIVVPDGNLLEVATAPR